MINLNKKMAKGAVWMVLFKLAERSIGLVSTIILARLLVPADFGLVALAMAMIAVLEILGAFSFDVVLIQNQQAERSHYDTAWTFNILSGGLSAVGVLLLAHPVAVFYNDMRLEWVMFALAFAPLVSGFENIGVVAFRKDMEFHKEFKFLITKKLVAFVVTMTIAFTFRNYWALIAGTVASRTIGVMLSYALHPYRPRFSLARRHDLFHFSKWLFINNVIMFTNNRASDFIVGKIAGPHDLGLFSVAYEVSNLPTTELTAPINRAVFPGYAKMGGDKAALRAGYLSVLGLIALITIPIGLGIMATADVFVPLVLGEKWLSTAALMQMLTLFGLSQALQNNIGSVYFALGQARTQTTLAFAYSVVLIPALIVGASWGGSMGAATALVVCGVAMFPINLFIVSRMLELHLSDFVKTIWRAIIAGMVMLAAVLFVHSFFGGSARLFNLFLELLLLVLVGAVVYCGVVFVLWRGSSSPDGAEKVMLRQLKNKAGKFIPWLNTLV